MPIIPFPSDPVTRQELTDVLNLAISECGHAFVLKLVTAHLKGVSIGLERLGLTEIRAICTLSIDHLEWAAQLTEQMNAAIDALPKEQG